MAIKLSSSHSRNRRLTLNNDINVTPLVDIMLVLLIVFMITAPMLVAGIKVDLPQSEANKISDNEEPITITITASSKLYIQDLGINSPKDLVAKLQAVTKENRALTIYIRADQKIAYGRLMEIVSLINKAGYTKIGLITANQK